MLEAKIISLQENKKYSFDIIVIIRDNSGRNDINTLRDDIKFNG